MNNLIQTHEHVTIPLENFIPKMNTPRRFPLTKILRSTEELDAFQTENPSNDFFYEIRYTTLGVPAGDHVAIIPTTNVTEFCNWQEIYRDFLSSIATICLDIQVTRVATF